MIYKDGDNVRRSVFDGNSGGHELSAEVADVGLVALAKLTAFLGPQDPHRLGGAGQNGGRKRSGEDESGSEAPHHIHQIGRGGDVSAEIAKGLAQGARDDVHLAHQAVPLADAGPVPAVEADGVDLVDKGESAEFVRHFAQLGQRTDGARHGVDRLEGDDLGHGRSHFGQELAEVSRIGVAEDVARDAAVADALDHGGVISGVGEDVAAGQSFG